MAGALSRFLGATVQNIGVTFLGKLGLSFHIEIHGFCGFDGFSKSEKSTVFQKSVVLQKFAVLRNLQFVFKICEIHSFYQNPRILRILQS